MELDQFRAFLAVADSGSFSEAARTLFLTQPAISKRIAGLESRLDTRLFDRIGREASLTEAGRVLYPHAADVVDRAENAARAVASIQGQVSGRLSLATNHHIGLWYLPTLLADYGARFPAVQLDLHFGDSSDICDGVAAGRHEFGLVTLAPGATEALTVQPLWEERMAAVCARDNELDGRPVSAAELAGYPAILPDQSTLTGQMITRFFDNEGLAANIEVTTNYLEIIQRLVRAGLGWSVLPEVLIGSLARIDIELPAIQRTLGLVYHPARTLSVAGERFIAAATPDRDARPASL